MGLAQGGLLAGAKSVLSTLWQVQDESAQRLLTDFYEQLIDEKSSRIHALAEAKRSAIRQGMPISTWSAYILWDAAVDG
ncbi:MAG: CHAT domain-containing protein [Planctomycetota bacterium]|jgi:CHAT domain-containing protein